MPYTAIGEAIPAIVSALNAANLGFTVFDGGTDAVPSDTQYVLIAATSNDPTEPDSEIAEMSQEWYGLGAKARREEMLIHCMSVGRASRTPEARALALGAIESVAQALPETPSPNTYNALITSVDRIDKANSQSGATVHVLFSITVMGRLVP